MNTLFLKESQRPSPSPPQENQNKNDNDMDRAQDNDFKLASMKQTKQLF